jgi:hypothetical protein
MNAETIGANEHLPHVPKDQVQQKPETPDRLPFSLE